MAGFSYHAPLLRSLLHRWHPHGQLCFHMSKELSAILISSTTTPGSCRGDARDHRSHNSSRGWSRLVQWLGSKHFLKQSSHLKPFTTDLEVEGDWSYLTHDVLTGSGRSRPNEVVKTLWRADVSSLRVLEHVERRGFHIFRRFPQDSPIIPFRRGGQNCPMAV